MMDATIGKMVLMRYEVMGVTSLARHGDDAATSSAYIHTTSAESVYMISFML